jgi:hypothetical protein
MTVSNKSYDMTGNQAVVDGVTIAYDAMTNVATPAASQASVVAGTGAPTFSATKGTLYLNLTGSSTSTRLYVNNGTTNWVAVTTAS